MKLFITAITQTLRNQKLLQQFSKCYSQPVLLALTAIFLLVLAPMAKGQSTNSVTQPVYKPFSIKDISAPYSFSRVDNSYKYRGLSLLNDKGSQFMMHGINEGYLQSVIASYHEAVIASYASPVNDDDINARSSIFDNQGVEHSVTPLWSGKPLTEDQINYFSRVFWRSYNSNPLGYQDYNAIKSVSFNTYINWHNDTTSLCAFWVRNVWHQNQAYYLQYKAFGESDNRLSLHESNGHTPWISVSDGKVCSAGTSVHEPNRMFFDRLRMAGNNTLQAYRFYKLDQVSNYCDYQGRDCGTHSGTTFGMSNDGRTGGATYFNQGSQTSRIELPKSVMDHIKLNDDFTISFWMQTVPVGTLEEYAYPSQTDTWLSALYALDSHNKPMLGIAVNKNGASISNETLIKSTGHIAFMRKTEDAQGNDHSWLQWLADPVRLRKPIQGRYHDADKVWTFVVLTVSKDRTQIYTYMPDQKAYSSSIAGRLSTTRFNFFTTDSNYLNDLTSWGVGAPLVHSMGSGTLSPIAAISDLALFETALSEERVRDLINAGVIHDTPHFSTGFENRFSWREHLGSIAGVFDESVGEAVVYANDGAPIVYSYPVCRSRNQWQTTGFAKNSLCYVRSYTDPSQTYAETSFDVLVDTLAYIGSEEWKKYNSSIPEDAVYANDGAPNVNPYPVCRSRNQWQTNGFAKNSLCYVRGYTDPSQTYAETNFDILTY